MATHATHVLPASLSHEEVLQEYANFDARWEEERQAHEVALTRMASPLYLFSEGVLTAAHSPYRFAQAKELSYDEWKDEQYYRLMAPVGTRVLLRRRQQDHPEGMMIYDTVMDRVDEPRRWDLVHVFYLAGETSPFPIPSKKRKSDCAF